MANLPRNGTPEEIWANGLTNRELAHVLRTLNNRFGHRGLAKSLYSPAEKKAALTEAAKRLDWPDNYEKHNKGVST